MKKLSTYLISIPILISFAQGKTLRIGLNAELIGSEMRTPVFSAEFLIPEGENREIFTGPYTVNLYFEENKPGIYDFDVNLYGLAPEYNLSEYKFYLRPREKTVIQSLPVKDGSTVDFSLALLDDTSGITDAKFPMGDTSLWGISETIHYKTHWVKGSLIDFKWNKVMSYLENRYDEYRKSYRLSESDKIDLYFHPEPTGYVFLDSENFYALQPKSRRIDLVYDHHIDAATPEPGCELLVYRLWGYGPKWMVKGLAKYHDDNMLRIRNIIGDYKKSEILRLLKDEKRIKNDTGSVITGALVFWLLQNESFAEFKKLYIQSTVLDFELKFEDIYKYQFSDMINRFYGFAENYNPSVSELDYYASFYFEQGNMSRARDYYRELSMREGGDRPAGLRRLATCHFYLGNYSAADSVYDLLLDLGDNSPETVFMKGEISLARGDIDRALAFYNESYQKGFTSGRLREISILEDRGEFNAASALLTSMDKSAGRLLDYSIEQARMKIRSGENADSLLNTAIQIAASSSQRNPDDPRPYFILGKAYALMNDYEKSIYYLNTAYFIEDSPFNQAFMLLEMGRTEDMLGERDRAVGFYRRVVELDAGEYQKMLAEKYLDSPYGRQQ